MNIMNFFLEHHGGRGLKKVTEENLEVRATHYIFQFIIFLLYVGVPQRRPPD